MRVDDEVRPFVQDGLLAFDDSYEHEVWQDSEGPRTTLVLHVSNPALGGETMRQAISAGNAHAV